jgi:hypothetical protein
MPTRSKKPGAATFRVEVGDFTPQGFWIVVGEQRMFIDFEDFPWFTNAPEAAIRNVERPSFSHLYWPELDIDLDIQSVTAPEKFPLIWK